MPYVVIVRDARIDDRPSVVRNNVNTALLVFHSRVFACYERCWYKNFPDSPFVKLALHFTGAYILNATRLFTSSNGITGDFRCQDLVLI